MLNNKGIAYSYLIVGEENVLIDTGFPHEDKNILKDLEECGLSIDDIDIILLTHHDIDHTGNLASFEDISGAQVYASEEDIPFIMGDKKPDGIKKILRSQHIIKTPQKIHPYPEYTGNIKIIDTPGHTPGHVCLLYKDILFIGDLFEMKNSEIKTLKSAMTWDSDLLKESIRKILDYDFKWICPSHSEPILVDNDILEKIKKITIKI